MVGRPRSSPIRSTTTTPTASSCRPPRSRSTATPPRRRQPISPRLLQHRHRHRGAKPEKVRRRRTGRLGRMLLALGAAAVLVLGFAILAAWARSGYYVAFDEDGTVAIYQGRQGGFWWFEPRARRRATWTRAARRRVEARSSCRSPTSRAAPTPTLHRHQPRPRRRRRRPRPRRPCRPRSPSPTTLAPIIPTPTTPSTGA